MGPEESLYHDRMWVSKVNYTLGPPPVEPVRVKVKVRYKSTEAPGLLHPWDDHAVICFDEAQRAVTPGQAAVFYQGDVVLGGGFIEADLPQVEERTPTL